MTKGASTNTTSQTSSACNRGPKAQQFANSKATTVCASNVTRIQVGVAAPETPVRNTIHNTPKQQANPSNATKTVSNVTGSATATGGSITTRSKLKRQQAITDSKPAPQTQPASRVGGTPSMNSVIRSSAFTSVIKSSQTQQQQPVSSSKNVAGTQSPAFGMNNGSKSASKPPAPPKTPMASSLAQRSIFGSAKSSTSTTQSCSSSSISWKSTVIVNNTSSAAKVSSTVVNASKNGRSATSSSTFTVNTKVNTFSIASTSEASSTTAEEDNSSESSTNTHRLRSVRNQKLPTASNTPRSGNSQDKAFTKSATVTSTPACNAPNSGSKNSASKLKKKRRNKKRNTLVPFNGNNSRNNNNNNNNNDEEMNYEEDDEEDCSSESSTNSNDEEIEEISKRIGNNPTQFGNCLKQSNLVNFPTKPALATSTAPKPAKFVKFKVANSSQTIVPSASSSATACSASNSSQPTRRNTPPHKKFRKLRLVDNTPHTPKTLIKKSAAILHKPSTNITTASTSTSNEVSKRDSATMTTKSLELDEDDEEDEVDVTAVQTSQTRPVLQKAKSVPERFDDIDYSPPPNSQQSRLLTEIIDHAVQTPKSVVRANKRYTPGSLLTQQSAPHSLVSAVRFTGDESSPVRMQSDTCADIQLEMEVDQQQNTYKPPASVLQASGSIRNSASRVKKHFTVPNYFSATSNSTISTNLRMRLFDNGSETVQQQTLAATSKVLNFDLDSTDNEAPAENQHYQRALNNSDDEMSQLFGQQSTMPASSSVTPLSFNHQKSHQKQQNFCSSVPVPLLQVNDHAHSDVISPGVSNQNIHQSLFKPITMSRIKQQQQQQQHQHFQMMQHLNGFSYGGALSCHQRTTSISSISSICSDSSAVAQSVITSVKSPHSPFYNNQFQANINPFTPTSLSVDSNSKLSSASNAAAMVKLAAANLHNINGNSQTPGNAIKKTDGNSSIGPSSGNKRSYTATIDTTASEHKETETDANSRGANVNNIQAMEDNEDGLLCAQQHNTSSNNDHNDSSLGLPRNKRLALRQCKLFNSSI
jgi:hypothetical protein